MTNDFDEFGEPLTKLGNILAPLKKEMNHYKLWSTDVEFKCDCGKLLERSFNDLKSHKKDLKCEYCSIDITNKANKALWDKVEKWKGKEKKEVVDDNIYTSFVIKDEIIYEQLDDGKFIFKDNDGEYIKCYEVEIDGIKHKPILLDNDEKEVVIFPTDIKDYENIQTLHNEIKNFIHEYLDVTPEFETFASWYVILSWVYDTLDNINYLRALGDTGTGKSRFLDCIGNLCYKPINGSGGVTAAAIKRIINKYRGTILIDEGDFRYSDEKNELIKILNLGYEKNRTVYNCDKNDPSKLEFFRPYCPKVITSRKGFEDPALESRCITEIMRQTTRNDIPMILPKKFKEEQKLIRNKLLKFRFDNYFKINTDEILNIDLGNVEPRIKQASLGFTVLFHNIPETLNSFKEFIKKYNENAIEERANTMDGKIVKVIIDLILEGNKEINSKTILEFIKNVEPKSTSTTSSIGKRLKSLGLPTKAKFINGKTKRIIPIDNNLIEVIKRYCTDIDKVKEITVITGITALTLSSHIKINSNNTHNTMGVDKDVMTVISVMPVMVQDIKKLNKVYDILSKMPEYSKAVPINELIMRLDWTDKYFDKLIGQLKSSGDYYEPKPGHISKL